MSDVDLVRNLLLGSVGDEDERYRAYDELWLPMERAQGDGNAAILEDFMRVFIEAAEPMGPPQARRVASQPLSGLEEPVEQPWSLLEAVARLLRARGGAAGVASLCEHGTAAADAAVAVDGDAATCAALGLLREMSAAAVTR